MLSIPTTDDCNIRCAADSAAYTFVPADLDRIPGVASCSSQAMQSNVAKLTDTVEQLISRMERMERNIAGRDAQSEFPPLTSPVATSPATAPAAAATKPSDKTFANLATDLASSKPQRLVSVNLQLQADDNRTVQLKRFLLFRRAIR